MSPSWSSHIWSSATKLRRASFWDYQITSITKTCRSRDQSLTWFVYAYQWCTLSILSESDRPRSWRERNAIAKKDVNMILLVHIRALLKVKMCIIIYQDSFCCSFAVGGEFSISPARHHLQYWPNNKFKTAPAIRYKSNRTVCIKINGWETKHHDLQHLSMKSKLHYWRIISRCYFIQLSQLTKKIAIKVSTNQGCTCFSFPGRFDRLHLVARPLNRDSKTLSVLYILVANNAVIGCLPNFYSIFH